MADFTELEWSLRLQAPAIEGDVYQFAVFDAGIAIPGSIASIVANGTYYLEAGLSIPVAATVTAPTETFTHVGNFTETGLQVPIVATTVGGLAGTPTVYEDWTGANGAAWSTARWTDIVHYNGTGTIDIQANAGRIACATGVGTGVRALQGQTDLGWMFKATFDLTASSSFVAGFRSGTEMMPSSVEPMTGYYISYQPNTGTFSFRRRNGDQTTNMLGTTVFGASAATRWFRVQALGTNIQVKTWLDGGSEPAAWTFEATDAAWGSGYFSYSFYGGGTGTRTVTIDDLTVFKSVERADFNNDRPASLPIVATFTAPTQTFTHAGNFNETGLSIPIVATTTVPTDLLKLRETVSVLVVGDLTTPVQQVDFKNLVLAIPITSGVTPTALRKQFEAALSVPVVSAVAATNQADFKNLVLSVPIVGAIDRTDNQSSSGHFDETAKSIDIVTSAVLSTQLVVFRQLGLSVPGVGEVIVTDSKGYHQSALSVPVVGAVVATASKGYHQSVLSIPIVAVTTTTVLVKCRDLESPISIVAELTVTHQADFKTFPTLSVPFVADIGVFDDIHREGENRSVHAVATFALVEQADFKNLALSVPVAVVVTASALLKMYILCSISISATVTRTDKMGSTLVTVLGDADALYLGERGGGTGFTAEQSRPGRDTIIYAGYGGLAWPTASTAK